MIGVNIYANVEILWQNEQLINTVPFPGHVTWYRPRSECNPKVAGRHTLTFI